MLSRYRPSIPLRSMVLRIVCISDTHDNVPANIPYGDVLIHAGDFTTLGTPKLIRKFAKWFGALPHPHKIVVAGNHELSLDSPSAYIDGMLHIRGRGMSHMRAVSDCEKSHAIMRSIKNCTYLVDEAITIAGVKFYGSPWIPRTNSWGFGIVHEKDREEKWKLIPDDTNVLITHTPPYGVGDLYNGTRHGCRALARRTKVLSPTLHVFGHIHPQYGLYRVENDRTLVNAALCDNDLNVVNKPIVVSLETNKLTI